MNPTAVAKLVGLLRTDRSVVDQFAVGTYPLAAGVALSGAEQAALTDYALRLQGRKERPKFLNRLEVSAVWLASPPTAD